ncbi:MAG: arylsulfatase [Mariniphaga sp.]
MKKSKGTLALCGALVLTSFGYASSQKATPPNIILIMTDDQGWGDLSISGNTNLKTPSIDKLAREGVTFDHFMVSPVCSPTRAELLTGRYHPRGGVYATSAGGERLDLDEKTIADYFKQAGYATAAYGKWHNGMQPPYHPNARGFDDFYGFCSGHWGDYFSPMLEHNGRIATGNGFLIDDFTNRGIDFITRNENRPFFLFLPYNTPHSPMQVPDKWWNRFKNKNLEMRHRDPEKEDVPFTRAALAMCENIDWNVGRLISKVEELGLSENTIIIYLSDNGPNSWRWNGGMKGRKGSVDEGGVRAPMFIKWEGKLPAGKKVQEVAGAIDLLPTLADLAGIDFYPENQLDGINLKPLLAGENTMKHDRFLFSHWNGRISIRSNSFRFIDNGKLYDMQNDPGQTADVADKFPKVESQMAHALEEWKKNVLSELPETDERPFVIGHPGFQYTHIPARDGIPHGNIKRSNQFPNDSFFTNWTSTSDSITWDVEVPAAGNFEVEIYYTCPPQAVGSVVELSFAGESLSAKITSPHNPPLKGMENDRVERMESYVKDFKPLKAGTISLPASQGKLTLKATEITGSEVMDFRLIVLKRI